jgi:hypothetical protein
MRTVSAIKWQSLLGCGLVMLVLAFALAACGAGSSSGGGSVGSQPGASSSPTPVKGYGTGYGCPSDDVITTTPPAATRVLLPKDASSTITVSNGAIIEIHLPFGQKWQGPINTQSVLQEQQPAGYAAKDVSACVWRFVANSTGTTHLDFDGSAICPTGKACPMYIMSLPFTIKVQ